MKSWKEGVTTMCIGCAAPIEQKATGRWKDYCSPACRQRAYRQRHGTRRPHARNRVTESAVATDDSVTLQCYGTHSAD